eukprot:758485-Hanusia_phi.AAC.1
MTSPLGFMEYGKSERGESIGGEAAVRLQVLGRQPGTKEWAWKGFKSVRDEDREMEEGTNQGENPSSNYRLPGRRESDCRDTCECALQLRSARRQRTRTTHEDT